MDLLFTFYDAKRKLMIGIIDNSSHLHEAYS